MINSWEQIDKELFERLSVLPDESKNVIAISTFFNPEDKSSLVPPLNYQLTANSASLLKECARILQFGGLLFVYGLPHHLAHLGQYLFNLRDGKQHLLFKYWITLDIDERPRNETLKPTSLGLLMFLKSNAIRRTPSPFHLNTSTVRVPYIHCSACGLNVKDWGGKKHLMNPNGASLSDIWRDLQKIKIEDHIIPEKVLERILALTKEKEGRHLHVIQDSACIKNDLSSKIPIVEYGPFWPPDDWGKLKKLEKNSIYEGQCTSFMYHISKFYPEGVFDMAFADPPYNLNKGYDQYEDALIEEHYINWCNQWLEGMVRTLKPGGSLFVLNLPKWAIHHGAYLNRRLEFRHWITWDALADPRGKLMPAHYALLYYTKPGARPIFNYSALNSLLSEETVLPPDSPQYCLRASCIKRRKRLGDNKKVELSDVWFDIHRIKHKRDRDAHPCQLPEKLMERLILLTTHRGGLVFDPFAGAGTTAIAASKLGRNFVTVDSDPKYVKIAKEKLNAMKQHADMFGVLAVPRQTVRKKKKFASKKEIELYLQQLAQRLGKEPSEEEIDADILDKIDQVYPTRLAAIKRCRVVLSNIE